MTTATRATITEKQLDAAVTELAATLGWHRYHSLISIGSPHGFPDLVLIRPPRVVFAELKSEKGRLRPHQVLWLDLLGRCPGVEVYLWRPEHLEAIARTLAPRYRDGPPPVTPSDEDGARRS